MLLRSCDSWTNTCLTAWEQRREWSRSKHGERRSLSLSPAAAPAWRAAPTASAERRRRERPQRATGVASRSPAVGPYRPRTRGAVRGHAVDHDADFKPFFAMI